MPLRDAGECESLQETLISPIGELKPSYRGHFTDGEQEKGDKGNLASLFLYLLILKVR